MRIRLRSEPRETEGDALFAEYIQRKYVVTLHVQEFSAYKCP
jgi:hypothetical protein